MHKIKIDTKEKNEIIDITRRIEEFCTDITEGFLYIHVPHTTAAITVNENADDDVKKDIIEGLKVFDKGNYMHVEGNSPAHIKSSLMGQNLLIRVEKAKPVLGTWQGIMFCEFDGPRNRQVWIEKAVG